MSDEPVPTEQPEDPPPAETAPPAEPEMPPAESPADETPASD